MNQDWVIFVVDLFMITSAAFIFINTFNRKYIEFARIYMCVLVSVGSSMSVIANGPEQFYWVYPASLTTFFLVSNKVAFFLVFLICGLTFPEMHSGLETMHLVTAYVALFGSSMFIYVFSNEVKQENSHLDILANMDSLTNCGNRRAFDIDVQNRLKEFETYARASSLLIMDLDDFKILNDTYGHPTGDAVLRDLSESVRTRLRKSDEFYRLGGEEFAILISDADLQESEKIADEIMQAIREFRNQELPLYTVSMGVACMKPKEDIIAWLDRADQAMYQAKRSGKNKFILADNTPQPVQTG